MWITISPFAPDGPGDPGGPVFPCNPCGPAEPVIPIDPLSPFGPRGPGGPCSPFKPFAPWMKREDYTTLSITLLPYVDTFIHNSFIKAKTNHTNLITLLYKYHCMKPSNFKQL